MTLVFRIGRDPWDRYLSTREGARPCGLFIPSAVNRIRKLLTHRLGCGMQKLSHPAK